MCEAPKFARHLKWACPNRKWAWPSKARGPQKREASGICRIYHVVNPALRSVYLTVFLLMYVFLAGCHSGCLYIHLLSVCHLSIILSVCHSVCCLSVVCLFVCHSVCLLSVILSIVCLLFCLSICCLSFCLLSVYCLSIIPSVCHSVCLLSVILSVHCLSVCLLFCLSFCLSICCLSVCCLCLLSVILSVVCLLSVQLSSIHSLLVQDSLTTQYLMVTLEEKPPNLPLTTFTRTSSPSSQKVAGRTK